MARPIKRLQAEPAVVEELRRRSRARTSMVRERERAEIILLRLEGLGVAEIALRLKTTAKRVSTWSKRFETRGLAGLEEAAGRGRKPSIPTKKVDRVVTEVTRPPKGRKRWSVRSMGRHAGVSHSTVQRIWSKNDLKPHVTRTFKLSTDTDFEKKFWDVIGLYLDPPANALVLCCDEKSQCQALERSQPGLPLGPRHPRTMTHDYRRHGTTTLFAALDYLQGKLITRTEERHTHVEWLRFLKQIDRETPKSLELHLIADNYATHKHPKVKAWLAEPLGTAINQSEPPHIHRAGQDIGRHVGNQRKSVRLRRGMELDPAYGFVGGVMKVSCVGIDIPPRCGRDRREITVLGACRHLHLAIEPRLGNGFCRPVAGANVRDLRFAAPQIHRHCRKLRGSSSWQE